jgi:hypothetical protein
MIAAIAEIRRIDPVASAAVKAFKPSKVVEDDTATRVGNAKSDGAANETVSKKPSQSSRTPYIRSWRKNNRGLESELRCLLSIRSPLVPKSKEALYTHAIERIEASRRAQPFQENDKSQKVHLAHQLSASTLQSTARIGVARHQRTQVHRGLPLMDGLPPPLHPHSGAMAHSVPISPALFYHYCICYAVQTVGMPFARAHKWATHMINPASMGSSNMPGPGHNNGVSGGLPQDMLSRVLYASSRSSEEPILSGSIPPLFFRTTDGSDATASVHTESGGELHSRGKLHAHTALPSASFQQPQLPVNPVRKGR